MASAILAGALGPIGADGNLKATPGMVLHNKTVITILAIVWGITIASAIGITIYAVEIHRHEGEKDPAKFNIYHSTLYKFLIFGGLSVLMLITGIAGIFIIFVAPGPAIARAAFNERRQQNFARLEKAKTDNYIYSQNAELQDMNPTMSTSGFSQKRRQNFSRMQDTNSQDIELQDR